MELIEEKFIRASRRWFWPILRWPDRCYQKQKRTGPIRWFYSLINTMHLMYLLNLYTIPKKVDKRRRERYYHTDRCEYWILNWKGRSSQGWGVHESAGSIALASRIRQRLGALRPKLWLEELVFWNSDIVQLWLLQFFHSYLFIQPANEDLQFARSVRKTHCSLRYFSTDTMKERCTRINLLPEIKDSPWLLWDCLTNRYFQHHSGTPLHNLQAFYVGDVINKTFLMSLSTFR